MTYALIGCGRIAHRHIAAAKQNNLEILAVCDLEMEKAQALVWTHGLPHTTRIYTNYRKMCRECDLELVAIATESGSHAAIARELLEQGIHVLLEKPIALSIQDAEELVLLSQKKGVFLSPCHQNRFNPAVQALRRAVEHGRFGQLSHGSLAVRWNRGHSYYAQGGWRGSWAQDGGCLMNQCIHGIDLLRWMMGSEPIEVFGTIARRHHPYLEAEDIGLGTLRFANGAVATIEGTVNVYPQNLEETIALFGENGTVRLGGIACNRVDVWQFADALPEDAIISQYTEPVLDVYGGGHSSLYADVIEAIQTGRAPYLSATDGRDALEVVLAIYRSAQTARPVPLPLASFSTLQMRGFFDRCRSV